MRLLTLVALMFVALLPSVASAQESQPKAKAHFLIEAKYSDSGWEAMSNRPQDRSQLLQAVVGKLGGTVDNFWFSFGDYDVYVVVSLPDNTSAEALQIAGYAGGGFKVLRTTPLLSVAEAMTAMQKAGALRSGAEYKKAHDALQKSP